MKSILIFAVYVVMLTGLGGQTPGNVKVSQDAGFGYYRVSFDLPGGDTQAFRVKAIPNRKDMRIEEPKGIWSRTMYPGGTGNTIFWYPCLDGVDAEGWGFDLEISESPLVHVAGGAFRMGSDSGNRNESPVHPVRVDSFYIQKHELSVAEYSAFLESTMYKPLVERGLSAWQLGDGKWIKYDSAPWLDPQLRLATKHPVTCLGWFDLIPYCNWRSRMEGLEPVYSYGAEADPEDWTSVQVTCDFGANGYRLPTEAEWEYAARGGKQSEGYLYSGSGTSDEVAWYQANSQNRPARLGVKAPNELGLFDMSGNVCEWCWDWYGQDYYAQSPESNPTGKQIGVSRVFRGGSYAEPVRDSQVSSRNHLDPLASTLYLGARLVTSGRKSISDPGDRLVDEIEAIKYWVSRAFPSSRFRAQRDAEIEALIPPEAREMSDDEFVAANPQIVKQAQQIYEGYEARISTYSRQFELHASGLRLKLYRLLVATRERVKLEGSLGAYDAKAQLLKILADGREFEIQIPSRHYKVVSTTFAQYQITASRQMNKDLEWDYLDLSVSGPLGRFESERKTGEIQELSVRFDNTVPPAQARGHVLKLARIAALNSALPDWITFADLVADTYGFTGESFNRESAAEVYESTAMAGRIRSEALLDEQFTHPKGADEYYCKIRYHAEVSSQVPAEELDVELGAEVRKAVEDDSQDSELVVSSDRDGYLYVFKINSDKQVTLLSPSAAQPLHRIAAGQTWSCRTGITPLAMSKGFPETLYIIFSEHALPSKANSWFDAEAEEAGVPLGEASFARFQSWLSDVSPGSRKDLLLQMNP